MSNTDFSVLLLSSLRLDAREAADGVGFHHHRGHLFRLDSRAPLWHQSATMLWRVSSPRHYPAGFVEPCLPTVSKRVPEGPQWIHEIKHDGYRMIVRRDGDDHH